MPLNNCTSHSQVAPCDDISNEEEEENELESTKESAYSQVFDQTHTYRAVLAVLKVLTYYS